MGKVLLAAALTMSLCSCQKEGTNKMLNDPEIRAELTELTCQYKDENRKKLKSVLRLVEEEEPYEDCADFAFRNHHPRKLMNGWYGRWREIFWEYTKAEKPKKGDLAAYCDDSGMPKHFGEYAGAGRVRSVFGNIPGIWEHGLWEVPEEYGDVIRFYTDER